LPIVSHFVTGATRGIAGRVAGLCPTEGAHLILVGRTAGALEEVDDEIRASAAAPRC
jgi:short-subunit dehydrogenase